jgi:hypothetical protein
VDARLSYPPGARRVDRPAVAVPCATCGDLTGRGYPTCAACTTFVDRFWQADWAALADADPEGVADAPVGEYAWTCVDWALRQLRCAGCRGELAAGAPDCVGCAAANSARWEWPGDDVALRTAVVVLRAPTWHRPAVVSTWRLLLPFVLTGASVAGLVAPVRTQVLAGRLDELTSAESLTDLAFPPLLPWRRH